MDFAALLNEKRHGFCGREWLFEEIEDWRMAFPREPALLIVGPPGCGKSAIVAELIHRNPSGQVLAYHCCQADTEQTLEPWRFVRSVAAMIASKLDGYATMLTEPSLASVLTEENCKSDPASAFEEGVLTPLERLPKPEEGVRYILIDALDESLNLRKDGTNKDAKSIVQVLASRLSRLPSWLKIVATTRNEPDVINSLRQLRFSDLDAADARNRDDIDRFLSAQLSTKHLAQKLAESGLTSDEAVQVLSDKSGGNFLYAQQALLGLERDQYTFHELQILPPGLHGHYHSFFQRYFPDEVAFSRVKAVLEVVVAAQQPLTEQQLSAATGLNIDGELPRVLRALAVYLPPRREMEESIRYAVFHKSLSDWLTNPELRGTSYYVSVTNGHNRLADMCWSEYESGADVMSSYAMSYLPTHLLGAGRLSSAARLLADRTYVSCRCQRQTAFDIVADYDATLTALLHPPADSRDRKLREEITLQLLTQDFEEIEPANARLDFQGAWSLSAAEILSSNEGGRPFITTLFDINRKATCVTVPLRIAIRAASLARQYDVLMSALSFGRLHAAGALAENELYFAGSDDLATGSHENLAKLFAEFRQCCSSRLRLWQHRRRLKTIAITAARLFMDSPRDQQLRDELRRLLQTFLDTLPKLNGIFFRRVILPLIARVIYPVVRQRWSQTARHSETPTTLEQACTIRPGEAASLIRSAIDVQCHCLYDPVRAEAEFSEIIEFLHKLGRVCRKDPNWGFRRSLYGNIFYRMMRLFPQRMAEEFIRPVLDSSLSGIESSDDGERLRSLLDMIIGYGLNNAAIVSAWEGMGELTENVVRTFVSAHPEVFCSYYNMAGRPFMCSSAVAMSEARFEQATALERTRRIVEDAKHGVFAADHALRLQIVSKCLFDMLYVGSRFPQPVLRTLRLLSNPDALHDGQGDGEDGEPNLATISSLLMVEVDKRDPRQVAAAHQLGGRYALLVEGLNRLHPRQTAQFCARANLDRRAIHRLKSWMDYVSNCDGDALSRSFAAEKLVEKFGDQAKVGLFLNVLFEENAQVRQIWFDTASYLLDYCQRKLGRRTTLSPREVRRCTVRVLTMVSRLARDAVRK